jgi:hypothetical protein
MIRLQRSLAVFAVLLFCAASLHAQFRKPYFAKTKVGSWADYRSDDGIAYRYTRLPDLGKQVRLSLTADFSKTKYAESPASTTQYTIEEGFDFDHDGMSFGRYAAAILTVAEGSEVQALDKNVLTNIRAFAVDYGSIVKFKGSETLNGKQADHYTYIARTTDRTETGDLWMSDVVPFGLVKQSTSSKDAAGAVTQSTMELTASGASGSKAEVIAAAMPGEPPPLRRFSLDDAYDEEAVRLKVEVIGGSGGSRLRLTLVNKLEAPVEVTVPKGATTFHGAAPVSTLSIVSPAEKTLTIEPGDEASLEVRQAPLTVSEGTFELSMYEGEPLFSGSVTLLPH